MKPSKKKQRKGSKGFTLIELMIVVAIIAILASIALPQYLRFSAKSKRVEGVSILSGLHKTEIAYFASEDSFPSQVPPAGSFPPELGYEVSNPKYYFIDSFYSSPQFLVSGTSATEYVVLLFGQLDGDPAFDILCISYPDDNCPIDAEPAQVTVHIDDVTF